MYIEDLALTITKFFSFMELIVLCMYSHILNPTFDVFYILFYMAV